MDRVLLCLDSGTTAVKAAAFDGTGRMIARAERANGALRRAGARVEQDMDATRDDAFAVLRDCVAQLQGPVAGLVITGQGDGLWPVDAAGQPVGHALTWLDGRARGIAAELGPELDAVQAITGSRPTAASASLQLRWLERHEPERFARIAHALRLKEWLFLSLTGEVMGEPGAALPVWGNWRDGCFSEGVEQALGLSRGLALLPAFRPVGTCRAGLRAAIGLPLGTPVLLGPGDVQSTLIGLGLGSRAGVARASIFGTSSIHACLHQDPAAMADAPPGAMVQQFALGTGWLCFHPGFNGATVLQHLARLGADLPQPAKPCWSGLILHPFLEPGGERAPWTAARIRPVHRVLDAAPMRAELRSLLSRAADYTLTPLPAMLRLATRAPGLGDPASTRRVYRLGGAVPNQLTEARFRVVEALRRFGAAPVTLGELAEEAGCGTSVVKGLVKLGVVLEEDAPRDLPYPPLNPRMPARLAGDQVAAGDALVAAVAAESFAPILLKGVTGSGKTEVYLEAVAECLTRGRQALVLLPEIALTADFLARVEARFGARPAEWHSGVTQTERRRLWRMVGQGGAQLVVGARSALFLPFRDLGLIVVDEEHDTSYKQEDGVLYNARDMAVLRASIVGCPVVLASATPCLETWANVEAGKYTRLDLGSRFGVAEMPEMRAIDMRAEQLPADRWISVRLAGEVQARIARGEQSLLFLNRRGYAPVTLCRACGAQVGCDQCDARMVEHRFLKRLVCHQCGATKPVPETCPSCGVAGRMAAVGPGVERLAEEVTARFPEARLAVLSSDLFGSARALKEAITGIAGGGADIIIGTQIVAKGHNFPLLTLVGVIDADLGLQGSDLRAAERTFQLMRQVAGRAGRAERKGVALLQTHQPEHPVIRAILGGDEEAFWRAEAAERRAAGVPPYGRMVGIILSSPDVAQVFDVGAELARRDGPLRRIGAEVWGPAPAPVARVRGRHRVRLLVKAAKTAPVQAAVAEWVAQLKLPANLRLTVDIDPQSFY